jgi:hypothetical protein
LETFVRSGDVTGAKGGLLLELRGTARRHTDASWTHLDGWQPAFFDLFVHLPATDRPIARELCDGNERLRMGGKIAETHTDLSEDDAITPPTAGVRRNTV